VFVEDIICGGVLDKYPGLRVGFLEAGGGWIPYWLGRLDEFYEKIGHMVPKAKISRASISAGNALFRVSPTMSRSRWHPRWVWMTT
jgi:hypothetical protein